MRSTPRRVHPSSTRSGRRWVAPVVGPIVGAVLAVASLAALPDAASAAAPRADPPVATWVDVRSAATFSVLGGAGVANTGAGTDLAGDVGLSPAGVLSGFPPGTTHGTIHDKDDVAEAAQADRQLAYDEAAAQPSTTTFSGDQAGVTFGPGVHTSAAAFTNTGTMTLDAGGDPTAVFVFQIGAAFGGAAASKVVLTGGAIANNVFWQVVGALSFGAGAKYAGTYLGAGAITIGDGASIKGRVLTPGTVALTNNVLTITKDDLTAPLVTIDGGASRSTNDTSPPISGTTDELSGAVTVTVGDQSVTTTAGDDGRWTVGTTTLAEGAQTVVAAVSDASQNLGTATQELAVDVTAPTLALDGAGSRATSDTTPTVSGTTDAAPGTPVAVRVGDQSLATTVDAAGAWTVDVAALAETSHLVVATIADAAGNTGSATQVLTVDLTVPVLTINGGASRSTADLSPWTYGTTAEKAGTLVHLTVGGQSLTAVVAPGGTWGVSAADLGTGSFTVIATITDAAGNAGSARQALLVTGGVTSPPPAPTATYRPDAEVRAGTGGYVGARAYAAGQQVTQKMARGTRSRTFTVRLTNRGNTADAVVVTGTAGNARFAVTYRVSSRNVSPAVVAGTWRSGVLQPGAAVLVTVTVTRTTKTTAGSTRTFRVVAGSAHQPTTRDAVGAVVRAVA